MSIHKLCRKLQYHCGRRLSTSLTFMMVELFITGPFCAISKSARLRAAQVNLKSKDECFVYRVYRAFRCRDIPSECMSKKISRNHRTTRCTLSQRNLKLNRDADVRDKSSIIDASSLRRLSATMRMHHWKCTKPRSSSECTSPCIARYYTCGASSPQHDLNAVLSHAIRDLFPRDFPKASSLVKSSSEGHYRRDGRSVAVQGATINLFKITWQRVYTSVD